MTLGLTEAQFWEYTPRHVLTLWNYSLIESERRMDRRFAVLYTMYANTHRDEKRHPKAFTVEDFLPGSKPVSSAMSPDAMLAEARRITEIFGSRRRTA